MDIIQSNIDAINELYNANKSIVWVASYPRSGNTWVRFLLTDLANKVAGYRDDAFHPDEFCPCSHANDISSIKSEVIPNIRCMKTHSSREYLCEHFGIEYFAKSKIIYLIRDPSDCLVSYYCYSKKNGQLAHDDVDEFCLQNIDGWINHVQSYISAAQITDNIIIVKYEDLLKSTEQELFRILEFLGLSLDAEDIATTIHKFDFQGMRSLEKSGELRSKSDLFLSKDQYNKEQEFSDGYSFIRKGIVGDSKNHLKEETISKINSLVKDALPSLFYSSSSEKGVSEKDCNNLANEQLKLLFADILQGKPNVYDRIRYLPYILQDV